MSMLNYYLLALFAVQFYRPFPPKSPVNRLISHFSPQYTYFITTKCLLNSTINTVFAACWIELSFPVPEIRAKKIVFIII